MDIEAEIYNSPGEFKTVPDLYWNICSVWQKICQHKRLTDMATICITDQVTQLSLEKEDYLGYNPVEQQGLSCTANYIQGYKSLL